MLDLKTNVNNYNKMSFLPEIEDGKLLEKAEPKLYTPPVTHFKARQKEEDRLAELNNFKASSDSPSLLK